MLILTARQSPTVILVVTELVRVECSGLQITQWPTTAVISVDKMAVCIVLITTVETWKRGDIHSGPVVPLPTSVRRYISHNRVCNGFIETMSPIVRPEVSSIRPKWGTRRHPNIFAVCYFQRVVRVDTMFRKVRRPYPLDRIAAKRTRRFGA